MTALMPQAMTTLEDRNIQDTLDLSESRAYDAALDILAAHKLTGNFRVNLEIVLKDIGAFDKVTYEIKPKSKLPYYPDYPDCRHVVFRPNEHVHMDKFTEIMRSIQARIGFDSALPWWVKVFRLYDFPQQSDVTMWGNDAMTVSGCSRYRGSPSRLRKAGSAVRRAASRMSTFTAFRPGGSAAAPRSSHVRY